MHSESLNDQDYALRLFAQPGLENNLKWAVITVTSCSASDVFRTAMRSWVRASTAEEIAYLESEDGYRG